MKATWHPVDIVLTAAAGIAAAAAFLPWAKLSAGPFTVSRDGIEGDGVVTLVAALAVAVVILTSIYGRTTERAMRIAVTIGGIVITAVGVYDWISIEEHSSSVSVSPGAGLILTVISGVALVLIASYRLAARPPLTPLT